MNISKINVVAGLALVLGSLNIATPAYADAACGCYLYYTDKTENCSTTGLSCTVTTTYTLVQACDEQCSYDAKCKVNFVQTYRNVSATGVTTSRVTFGSVNPRHCGPEPRPVLGISGMSENRTSLDVGNSINVKNFDVSPEGILSLIQ